MENEKDTGQSLKNSEAFKRFAKTGDPEALGEVITEITGSEVEKIETVETVASQAKRALAALRFRMIPELPDDMKELAYQQVLTALNRLDELERKYTTNTGQELVNVHDESECAGRHCVIHNPSDHHMRDWPMQMRTDAFAYGLIERFCEHGIGHPDPDSASYLNERDGNQTWSIHGCDGCCVKE